MTYFLSSMIVLITFAVAYPCHAIDSIGHREGAKFYVGGGYGIAQELYVGKHHSRTFATEISMARTSPILMSLLPGEEFDHVEQILSIREKIFNGNSYYLSLGGSFARYHRTITREGDQEFGIGADETTKYKGFTSCADISIGNQWIFDSSLTIDVEWVGGKACNNSAFRGEGRKDIGSRARAFGTKFGVVF